MTLSLIAGAFASDTAPTTASTAAPADLPPPVSQQKMFGDSPMFLVLLFGIFYFILIRPQQKRMKTHRAMLDALKKGDKILTAGGIVGTIVKIDANELVLVEIAPNVRVQVARHTITDTVDPAAVPSTTANDN